MSLENFGAVLSCLISIFNNCRILLSSFVIAGIPMWWWLLGLLGLSILCSVLRHVSIGEGTNSE